MPELTKIAELVVGWATAEEEVEVFVQRGRNTTVRVYQGDVESFSSAEPAGAGIRVIAGKRQGFAYAGTLDETVLKETLEEARDNAAYSAPDEYFGLARPDGFAPAPLDVYRPDLATTPPEAKIDLAVDLERRTIALDPRVRGVRTAMYVDATGEDAVATTTGITAFSQASRCYLAVQALAEDGGDTQIASGLSVGRHLDELDAGEAATEAATKAVALLNAKKPPSRRLTAVLEPDITADFLAVIGSTLSGEAVEKGRSLFANRLGENVAVTGLTLLDDPTDARAFGAEPFDGEGLARRRNVLIQDGVLQRFLYHTYAARRAGTASTASASRGYASTPSVGAAALSILPGTASQNEVLAGVGEGFLVQAVSGLHSGVNPISGDFSVGATGLMIRNGERAEPVREATIASTIQRMLLDIIAIGGDVRWLPGNAAGVTLAIKDVALSGT